MATTRDTIDHNTLARLVEAGAVRGTTVVGQPGGWGVVVQYGMTERALAAKRGAVRIWKRFETLVSYLKEMGLAKYQVDAVNYTPETPKESTAKRPDAAERMKRAHEAAAYDDWLRAKVAVSMVGIEQGTNQRIEPDEWAQIRARKRAA